MRHMAKSGALLFAAALTVRSFARSTEWLASSSTNSAGSGAASATVGAEGARRHGDDAQQPPVAGSPSPIPPPAALPPDPPHRDLRMSLASRAIDSRSVGRFGNDGGMGGAIGNLL